MRTAALKTGLCGGDVSFQHDLGGGRHLQHAASVTDGTVHQFGRTAPQQAGKLVFGQGVRYGRHRAQGGGGIGAQGHSHRKGLARVGFGEVAKVQRTAPVGQPAHDHLARPDDLLAVDADVLPQPGPLDGLRATCDHQAPGDQRPDIARPAMLDRPARQIDLIAVQLHLPAGAVAAAHRLHVPERFDHLYQPAGVLQTLRRFGLLQARQKAADLAQFPDIVDAHAQRDAPWRTKQIGQHGHGVAGGPLEPQRRSFSPQHAVRQRCHLQVRRNAFRDASKLAQVLQLPRKITQIAVFHSFKCIKTSIDMLDWLLQAFLESAELHEFRVNPLPPIWGLAREPAAGAGAKSRYLLVHLKLSTIIDRGGQGPGAR